MESLKNIDYSKLFKAVSKLYGVIESEELYLLLKRFYKNIKKGIIFDNLIELSTNNKDYFLLLDNDGSYLVNTKLNKAMALAIVKNRDKDISFYVPKNVEELLNYENEFFMTNKEKEAYDELKEFMVKFFDVGDINDKEKEINEALVDIHYDFRITKIGHEFKRKSNKKHFIFDEKDLIDFKRIFNRIFYFTRLYVNKGHSEIELSLLYNKMPFDFPEEKEEKKYYFDKELLLQENDDFFA